MHNRVGFSVVELIVVMVVIATLAAITIAAYQNTQKDATESAIKSDLSAIAKEMEMAVLRSSTTTYPTTSTAVRDVIGELFSRDSYRWVIYCTNSTEYTIAGRMNGTDEWYTIGSKSKLKAHKDTSAADYPGNSGNLATTCTNLGYATTTFSSWLKSNAGWSI